MEALWRRLIELMRPHAPEVESWLNTGASDEQLRAAEKAMGIRFPDEVAAFYRVHDGQKYDTPYFWQGSEIHSLERVVENWALWTEMLEAGEFERLDGEPTGPIQPDWWNPKWLPLTSNGGGDHHCLDLAPTEGGNIGQIFEFWHDWEARTLIAPSFTAWFEGFVTGCETGRFVWSSDEQSFLVADD